MSIISIIIFLINLFFSSALPTKQPIKIDNRNIFTTKSGVQDIFVTHYNCSPQHITHMKYYKINKIGECKFKPAHFHILPALVSIFSQIQTFQVRAYAIYAKLSNIESFCHKVSLNTGFRF